MKRNERAQGLSCVQQTNDVISKFTVCVNGFCERGTGLGNRNCIVSQEVKSPGQYCVVKVKKRKWINSSIPSTAAFQLPKKNRRPNATIRSSARRKATWSGRCLHFENFTLTA